MSTIIFLNGTSSSGKTSISKALQTSLDEPYLYLTADIRKSLLPPYREGVDWDIAAILDNLRDGFYACLPALAAHGNNIITDQAVEKPQWLLQCSRALKGSRAYLIGVYCPLDIAEQRERDRGDRAVGLVREHFDLVHKLGIYDLEVDTSVVSPEDCAQKIKGHIASHEPAAFSQLSRLPQE